MQHGAALPYLTSLGHWKSAWVCLCVFVCVCCLSLLVWVCVCVCLLSGLWSVFGSVSGCEVTALVLSFCVWVFVSVSDSVTVFLWVSMSMCLCECVYVCETAMCTCVAWNKYRWSRSRCIRRKLMYQKEGWKLLVKKKIFAKGKNIGYYWLIIFISSLVISYWLFIRLFVCLFVDSLGCLFVIVNKAGIGAFSLFSLAEGVSFYVEFQLDLIWFLILSNIFLTR